ncbi:MAG: siroheme synthase [Fibrobacter sp.]|nr:siroheme synthase [Fibrobacter sp.]
MKALLIIAHHSIIPGAFKGFEEVMDRLHHELPGTRVASTSLLDLEKDLRTLLREDVESVALFPYLLLNGQHARNDVPMVMSKLQAEFPNIPITLLPCLGDWSNFTDMVVESVVNAQFTIQNSKLKIENAGAESSTSGAVPAQNLGAVPPADVNNTSLRAADAAKQSLFAMEMNLEGRNVLVVGGGSIALRKVKTLLPTGARIKVVSPQFAPEFAEISSPNCMLVQHPYEPADLMGVFLAFICTDKPAVNAQVSNDARARRILVNNACDYLDGDFIVPARMDFGENIAVTVSTQGRTPALAKKLKQKIQKEWGQELVQLEKNFLDSSTTP